MALHLHLHLLLADGTEPARHRAEVTPLGGSGICHSFVDQDLESGATPSVDRQDIDEPMFAAAVVAENHRDRRPSGCRVAAVVRCRPQAEAAR